METDDGLIDAIRQIGQFTDRRVGLQALNSFGAGIDRVDRALKILLEIVDRPAWDFLRIRRGADDGDGARFEQGIEGGTGHEWAFNG